MVDVSAQNIPQRVLELLRTFLAASSRGDQAVLVLETRKCNLTMRYRNVETTAGVPACSSSPTAPRKKVNPSRARRSRLRLEQFIKKKVENKEMAGDPAVELSNQGEKDKVNTTKNTKKLVIELAHEEVIPLNPVNNSPILQLEGAGVEDKITYSFRSDYGEEDIIYTLSEIFPDTVLPTLVSRVRVKPMSAFHHCTVEIDLAADQKMDFSWPTLKPWQKDTFVDLTRI
jgi:hypothetical protein